MSRKYLLVPLAMLVCLVVILSCAKSNQYPVVVIYSPETLSDTLRFANGILSAIQFADSFSVYFRRATAQHFDSLFFDSLDLQPNKPLKFEAFLSGREGAFMIITNDSVAGIRIRCADLPAQYVFLKSIAPSVTSPMLQSHFGDKPTPDQFLMYYDSLKGLSQINRYLSCPVVYMPSQIFNLESVKLADIPKSTVLVLDKVRLVCRTFEMDTLNYDTYISEFVILCGDRRFPNEGTSLAVVCDMKVANVIVPATMRLRENSELFRASGIHSDIYAKADEISRKKQRAAIDPDFEYPPWLYQKDLLELKQLAAKAKVGEELVAQELEYAGSRVIVGTLFTTYESYEGFMWQWTILNALACFVAGLTILVKRLASAPTLVAIAGLLSAAVLFLNAWIVTSKMPEHMGVEYWVLPVVTLTLYSASAAILIPRFLKGRQSRS